MFPALSIPLVNMARKLCFKQTDRNIWKRKLFLRQSKYVNHNNAHEN